MISLGVVTVAEGKIEVFEDWRGGTKSPRTWYYKFNGRWITPYEIKVRGGFFISLTDLFKLMYPITPDLVNEANWLLQKIKKQPAWTGGTYVIPMELK